MRSPAAQNGSGLLIKISFKLSRSADVQGYAVEAATHHFGMSQFYRDYINTVLFDQFYQGSLIAIHDHQIRVNAESIHINPVTAYAFRQIFVIISLRVLHLRTVNNIPLFQDLRQGVIIDAARVAQEQTGAQGHKC
jgi:hypothetical protein